MIISLVSTLNNQVSILSYTNKGMRLICSDVKI